MRNQCRCTTHLWTTRPPMHLPTRPPPHPRRNKYHRKTNQPEPSPPPRHLSKRIIHNIPISPKIITKTDLYICRAIGLLGNCIGLNFTNGPVDLQLTNVFVALRKTSYLSPQRVTSRIVKANHHAINLTPGPPTTITSSPNSLRSPPSLLPRGRGTVGAVETPEAMDSTLSVQPYLPQHLAHLRFQLHSLLHIPNQQPHHPLPHQPQILRNHQWSWWHRGHKHPLHELRQWRHPHPN